jgi:hypothetical protein
LNTVIEVIPLGKRPGLSMLLFVLWASSACQEPPTEHEPGTFSFAALGDAPYGPLEAIRFRRVLRQLDAADLDVIIHVGDILWYPCSDGLFR